MRPKYRFKLKLYHIFVCGLFFFNLLLGENIYTTFDAWGLYENNLVSSGKAVWFDKSNFFEAPHDSTPGTEGRGGRCVCLRHVA